MGTWGFEPIHQGRRSGPFTEDSRAHEKAPERVPKKVTSHCLIVILILDCGVKGMEECEVLFGWLIRAEFE